MNNVISRKSVVAVVGGIISIVAGLVPNAAVFAALPAGFQMETLASGLTLPTAMAFVNDGRILISEKGGTVRVLKNGALLSAPLIQLTDVNSYGDRGLIGITIDPNFSTNGYVYLLYTYENTPGTNFAGPKTARLVRVTAVGDIADESTKVVLLGTVAGSLAAPSCENFAVTSDCIPSDSPSHSAGGLRFGPDGKLYVSLGDGSHFEYVDPRAMRSQNIDSLAGKILRINANGTAPTDNPFYNGSSTANRSKVFAYGFRNSYRFNFRPSNNALYGGDVGWSTWEEVNKVVAGANYGWPCREGNGMTNGYGCDANPRVDPIYTYQHDVNGAGSIAAGAFATAYPAAYSNSFFIGDYAQNWIKRVTVNATDGFVAIDDFMLSSDGSDGPVAIDRGPDGNIYYIAIYTGELRRFLYTTGNRQPVAVLNAAPTNGLSPLTVAFSATGSSDPDGNPLTYSWAFGDGAVSTSSAPSHTYSANGSYTAVLTVFDGQGGQNTKSQTISVGNRAPTAVISAPANGSLYRTGDTINLSGFGTDPEDGSIVTASKLAWTIILHHNTHTHTIQTLTGTNPSFPAPDHNSATDIYTEVQLTVTDAGGLTNTKSINLYLNNNPVSSGNLIANPSLEDAVAGSATTPEFWSQGGYGVNDTIYTYAVIGFDGADAAKVKVQSYSNGDAKWAHNPVSVTANTSYTFSGYYQSTVPGDVTLQIGSAGTYTYQYLGALAPSASWKRVDYTFTTPGSAQTAAVFFGISSVGEMTIDNFSLTQGSTTPPVTDTTAPTVSVTNPLAGNVATATTTLSANATDNVGVVDVKFVLDSQLINTDTTAPYSFDWDSKTVVNGSHSLTAVARDAAGNIATATPVSFLVSNNSTSTGTTTGANLVLNPSVETANGALPANWSNGKWGTNTTTFTYPVTGYDGAKGLKIQTTAYTNGDAKWFFKDVAVTPGTLYTYTSYYQSTVATNLTLRYTSTTGVVTYVNLAATVPASATWKQLSYTFTPPANTASVTVFHILAKVGTLTTDQYSLSKPGTSTPPTDTTAPAVTLTGPASGQTTLGTILLQATASDASGVAGVKFFVDSELIGSEDTTSAYEVSFNTATFTNGSHTTRAVARDTVGNIATSSVITFNIQNTTGTTTPPVSTSTNLITNGSFEAGTAGAPQGWNKGGWGTNTTAYNYPITGRSGSKAAEVRVTAYTSGDVKWYPSSIPMQTGKEYTFSSWYKSDTISDVIGEYKLSDGTYHYFGVIKELQPVTDWTYFSATFTPPTNAVSFIPMHLISATGYLAIDDVSLTTTGNATSTNDITAPVVDIVSPVQGATVSGTITVTASSSDNIAVTGVMFAVDGTPVTPLVQAPYQFVWNTTTVANGAHVLKATTHDAAGNNSATSTTVMVNNTTGTTTPPVSTSTPNLINNASLETTDTLGMPQGWNKGGWGTNTTTYTYPVAGSEGTKAAKVAMTAFTDGDAKWFFNPVAVTATSTYIYSSYYKSTAPTTLTARYTLNGGAFVYADLATVPAAANWTKYEKEIVMPANAVAFTVFHLIKAVGEVSVDQYSLSLK